VQALLVPNYSWLDPQQPFQKGPFLAHAQTTRLTLPQTPFKTYRVVERFWL
jgi:hypothetical protein